MPIIGFQSVGDFSHRPHPDGTFDSICLYCYRTVAAHMHLDELANFESEHVCQREEAMLDSPASRSRLDDGSIQKAG